MGCATAGAPPPAAADDRSATPTGDLRVVFIDVGQGDGMLIVSPTGKTVLIDAGLKDAVPAISAVIRDAGVKTLDLVIGSHAHADHIGGLTEILKRFGTRAYMDPSFPHESGTYRQLLEFLTTRKIKKITARAGRKIDLGGGATLTLLAPRDALLRGTRSDANTNSVVARLEMGTVSVLFTGDAEAPTERRLLEVPATLPSTILKVAHHGSSHSSTPTFLDAVKPEAAVISAGLNNRYGHPAPDTLRRLQQRKITVHRTDLHGNLTLKTDGRTWKITAAGKQLAGEVSGAADARGPPATTGENLMDINTADADRLRELPGIGPKKAEAIIAFRKSNGRFSTVDDIVKVRGIGAKTLEKLRPRIMVTPPPDQAHP